MKFTSPTRPSHLLVSLLKMNSRNILDRKGRKQGEIVQVNDNQKMVLAGHNLNMNALQSNVNRSLSNSLHLLVNKFEVGWSVVQWDPSWISNVSGLGQGPRPRLCRREQGPIRGRRRLGSVQRPPVKKMTDTHDWKHYLWQYILFSMRYHTDLSPTSIQFRTHQRTAWIPLQFSVEV